MAGRKHPPVDGKEIRNNYNFLNNVANGKRAYAYIPEKVFADFIIKINHEMIPYTKFILLCIEGFLKDNPNMLAFMEESLKEERPKYQVERVKREKKYKKKTEDLFGLNPDEIEDIYDIIEEEFDV